ncbi:L-lactate permease [Streptomyces sp. NPDC001275]
MWCDRGRPADRAAEERTEPTDHRCAVSGGYDGPRVHHTGIDVEVGADVLATKVAAWTSGIYLLLAPYIGAFGTFIIGSNLSSNLLFGAFQQTTAQAGGLSTANVLSAQTTGGALGTMISPSKILLGTTTAGIGGREGQVLRRTLPLTLVTTALVGLPLFLLARTSG